MDKTLVAIVVGFFAFLGLFVWAAISSHEDCMSKGGKFVFDGTYIYVWTVTDFKTGMGFMNMIPNTVCLVPAK